MRWCKVLKKDRDGGEEGLSVLLTRVWTLCELLVTVRRAPRLLGGSVSVELSMRWREEEGRLGNAEWLRDVGGLFLSCSVLDDGRGWEEASEAGEAERAASTDDEKNRVRAQRWACVEKMTSGKPWPFLAVSPPRRAR